MKSHCVTVIDIILSIGSFRLKLIKLIDFTAGTVIAFFLNPRTKEKPMRAPTTILVIRPGGIGDAVFLLPILKYLKAAAPQLNIDILGEKRNAAVFSSQLAIFRQVYQYDQPKELRLVSKNSYDLIIDTEQWHYLSAILTYVIQSDWRVGFATRPLRKKLFEIPVNYNPDAYELENFRKIFESAFQRTIPALDIEGSFEIPPQSQDWAAERISSKTIILYIGASIPVRRLTIEQCLDIIGQTRNKGLDIALIGGKDVEDAGLAIETKVRDPHVRNFIGKTSFMETAALIKKSQLFIGTDSGIMHLSCAVGTPTIALFGPGQLKKWAPSNSKHKIITENVSCSPCTRFGYTVPTCHGSYHCMRTLKLENILSEITERN